MRRFSLLAAALVAAAPLMACSDAAEPIAPVPAEGPSFAATSAGTTIQHFEAEFTAIALCGDAIGSIRFTGMIEGVDHTTTDGRGERHRTRQFRVKGMDGLNLMTGTTYKVIGGAEMLTWNTQIGQVPGVPAKSIHSGTLVFEPTDGGAKVVAHHSIRYVENANGEVVVDFHSWRCR
jgi:hypothetical protein